jgi:hypothetical protein
MLCALTVRTLEPGTFDRFRAAFMQDVDADDPPHGMVRFSMIRNVRDPDEVITFGVFEGTLEELRETTGEEGRGEQFAAIAPFVAGVGADGLYEVVEDIVANPR